MVALMATTPQLNSSPMASTAVPYKSVVRTVRLAKSGLKDVHPCPNNDALDSTQNVGANNSHFSGCLSTYIPLSLAKGDNALGMQRSAHRREQPILHWNGGVGIYSLWQRWQLWEYGLWQQQL